MLSRFGFHDQKNHKKDHFKGYILLIAWDVVDDTCLILHLGAVDKVGPLAPGSISFSLSLPTPAADLTRRQTVRGIV